MLLVIATRCIIILHLLRLCLWFLWEWTVQILNKRSTLGIRIASSTLLAHHMVLILVSLYESISGALSTSARGSIITSLSLNWIVSGLHISWLTIVASGFSRLVHKAGWIRNSFTLVLSWVLEILCLTHRITIIKKTILFILAAGIDTHSIEIQVRTVWDDWWLRDIGLPLFVLHTRHRYFSFFCERFWAVCWWVNVIICEFLWSTWILMNWHLLTQVLIPSKIINVSFVV